MLKDLHIKRVYAEPASTDGMRILVDRLWPRGLSKDKAAVDKWFRDIAPSTQLRKWYQHEPEKWNEFQERYVAELKQNSAPVKELLELINKQKVTLVFGAKDEQQNDAVVLKRFLKNFE